MDSSLTILIADDSEDDIQIVRFALKGAGLTNPVQVCRDGTEVIEYLQARAAYADRARFPFPRVLLLDLKMPKLSGFDVLAWIRNHVECKVIPCVVLTNSAEPSDVKKAYELGANAYLRKPGTIDELAKLLRCLCEFWSACELPALSVSCK